MFERQCLPRLARLVPKQIIRTLQLRVTGMGESDLDQLIAPVYKKYANPATTILAANGDLQIHLRARCATVGEAEILLAEGRAHRACCWRPHLFAQWRSARSGGGRHAAQASCDSLGGGKLYRRHACRTPDQRWKLGLLQASSLTRMRDEDGVTGSQSRDTGLPRAR